MGTIVGGQQMAAPGAGPESPELDVRADAAVASAPAAPPAAGSSAERISEALVRCMSRWGLAKTTIEDIAREAGVSRATVYRLFPGGKPAILAAASAAESAALMLDLSRELEGAENLEECLTLAIARPAAFLAHHPALAHMREHDPAGFDQVFAPDRLAAMLARAGELLRPLLARFVDEATALELGVWTARLTLSYFTTPATGVDLSDEATAGRLVREHLLPAVTGDPDPEPTASASQPS